MDQEQVHIETIINGCKKGERRAQELLYRNFYRSMLSLCLRYTKNEEDALEVLNNGFLKVFRNIQRYEPAQATLYTWIRTVVVNTCLDHIKAKAREEKHQELDEAVSVHIPAEVVGRMKATELLALVRKLPPATQAVFNLYVVEGYSHKEVAEIVGISEGTSKWHLSEARKQLQQLIKLQDVSIHE